ncbi:MAG: diguanylate cyclase [Pseudoxanthomonas sp.]
MGSAIAASASRRCPPPFPWVAGLCALWLLICGPAKALQPEKRFQDYVASNWSLEQGLPQLSVTAIAQDSTGYVWIGTQAGLARFDGNRFTTYDSRGWPGLGNGDIRALMADARGQVWIGTATGVSVHANGQFRQVLPSPVPIGPFEVNAVSRDAQGHVLVATSQGVYLAEGRGLTPLPGLRSTATALLQDGDALWVGGVGQVLQRRGDDVLQALPLPTEAASAQVTTLRRAHGTLWAGTSAGLFTLQAGQWRLFTADPLLRRAPIDAMLLDRDDTLWVSVGDRLMRLRQGKVAERVENQPRFAARSLLEDREGNLWIGSMISGLTRVWNGTTRRYSGGDGLIDPLLWTVAPGRAGQVWVGSNDGVALLDQGRFRTLLTGRQLPHPAAYALLVEADGAWIGTRSGVALLRDGALQRPRELAAMDGAQINGILRDYSGRLWFATSDGLYRWHAGRLTRFAIDQGLADPRARVLLETRDHRLLIGTYSGLYELEDERIQPVGQDLGFPPDVHVTALYELPDGHLLAGNLTRETLLLFNGQRWIELDQSRGIPANPAFSIVLDKGDLWISGLRGIYRLPLRDLTHAAVSSDTLALHAQPLLNERGDRHGGQKGDCCNGAGNARGFIADGAYWLPTRDGLVALEIDAVGGNPVPPTPLVERVQIQGQWRDVQAGGDWTLPAHARDLRFEFTALTFQAPEHADIRYRLLGYDRQWMTLEDIQQRSVNYTNLPPGHYAFEVIGVNNSGVASATPARLAFEVQPYFYEQTWFRVLAVLTGLLLVLLGYIWVSRRFMRQHAVLEALVHQRTRALEEANERLETLTLTDPLTGLHNRRYLTRQIPLDLAFYSRDAGVDLQTDAVIFGLLDVDHFKRINDTWGHDAGDRVLQQLAQCLRHLSRKGDYVIRWGGEEFLMVFRPMPRAQLRTLGERICNYIAEHAFDIGNGAPIQVTVSLGLMEYPPFPDAPRLLGWEQMVALADRALYEVKTHGRNGWAAWRPSRTVTPATDSPWEGHPGQLIDDGLLTLVGSHLRLK